MERIFKDEQTLRACKIAQMLQTQPKHVSFHTPGHKTAGWDITELAYSDNLASPQGCIAEAEQGIAAALGSEKSYILTDGSTCGVLSMLYAAKTLGVKRILSCQSAHKSVFNGCAALGLELLLYPQKTRGKIPFPYTMYELTENFAPLLQAADALLFTSPDYYGNLADLAAARVYCDKHGKLLLADGAHGGHLHYDKPRYTGTYADIWVDGVHKSLPALTQGAVVSAKDKRTAGALQCGVDVFRTTSPSYPIMASVEYAVLYPRNEGLERAVADFSAHPRIYKNGDWTKLCAVFGKHAFDAEQRLQAEGIYAEFCDGNVLCFYLSPATEFADFARLKTALERLFTAFPFQDEGECKTEENGANTPVRTPINGREGEVVWLPLNEAVGKVCAAYCGLFPPCTPLVCKGERLTQDKATLLKSATHTYGLKNGKIAVYTAE